MNPRRLGVSGRRPDLFPGGNNLPARVGLIRFGPRRKHSRRPRRTEVSCAGPEPPFAAPVSQHAYPLPDESGFLQFRRRTAVTPPGLRPPLTGNIGDYQHSVNHQERRALDNQVARKSRRVKPFDASYFCRHVSGPIYVIAISSHEMVCLTAVPAWDKLARVSAGSLRTPLCSRGSAEGTGIARGE